jgi:hypothetical protein
LKIWDRNFLAGSTLAKEAYVSAMFKLHRRYAERFGNEWRILSAWYRITRADLLSSIRCPEHREIYCKVVELELISTFSFQERNWLAEVAPHLLPSAFGPKIEHAKAAALSRLAVEATIPSHLLHTKGRPTCIPTKTEAANLAEVRLRVADAVGIQIDYTHPARIIERYEELMIQANS